MVQSMLGNTILTIMARVDSAPEELKAEFKMLNSDVIQKMVAFNAR